MYRIISAALLVLTVAACNLQPENPNTTEADAGVEELRKEVMTVHDTAMIKMNTMSKLQSRLKAEWKSSVDSLPYMNAYRGLQESKDDMMGWMRNFDLSEDASEEEARTYLLQEKKSIQAINAEMDKNIAEARFLLKNDESEMLEEGDTVEHHDHNH